MTPERGLAHLPVTLFSTVMGLGGAALAWRRASVVWGLPLWPSRVFLVLAGVAFAVVLTAYTLKWVRFPGPARAELRHPVRMSFAPTATIAVLVLATALTDLAPGLARVLWWVGAVGHLAATVLVTSAWFGRPDIHLEHVTPAWFIPVVGNVITPLAAAKVGSVELAWFAFGVGMLFWVGLLPVVFHRVLLHDPPLPQRLLPTLAIFVAPPSVALLSWVSLGGSTTDPLGRILYAAVVAFGVLLAVQGARLARLDFGLPFWALTFPLGAGASASLAMAGSRPGVGYDLVGGTFLVAATAVVLAVLTGTLRLAAQRRICVPEG